jgi:preprotein translocase subunit SecA
MMLAGMTGTAREVAGELWSVYRLNVKRIPTNRPSRRRSLGEIYYATTDQKFRAIVERVAELNRIGRPVLIGTRSVAASEHLSELLTRAGLAHRVLNARQDKFEAEIVAEAGQHAQITLATNMAGRGTDILLGSGVAELGGLFVLATERHDAGRIDRQFYGRCGRQGDQGEHLTMVSLEDDLMRVFYGRRLDGLIRLFGRGSGNVPALIGRPLTWLAQFSAERRHSVVRRGLLRADDSLEDLLAFSGRSE